MIKPNYLFNNNKKVIFDFSKLKFSKIRKCLTILPFLRISLQNVTCYK